MAKLRLVNRQGGWEILAGFVGGPLLIAFLAWLWITGNDESVVGWKWFLLVIGTIAAPFWAGYWLYRAIVVTTLWMEFTPTLLRVRKLRGLREFSQDQVSGLTFDNRPITMSNSDVGIKIPVADARYVASYDTEGKKIGEVRVTAADRSRLIRYLQEHGARQWIPR